MPGMRRRSLWVRGDDGASAIEYTGLIVLAAVILGGLYVILPGPVRTRTHAAVCAIMHLGDGADCRVGAGAKTDDCEAFCPTRENPIHPSDPVVAATKGNFVALGDSYASGEGANGDGGYLPGSSKDGCHRASAAAAEGLRKEFTFKGGSRFVACSGATTVDLANGRHGENPQFDALDPHTTTVTLTIGGNDLHFVPVMTACMTDLHFSLKFWDPPKEDQCHAQRKNIDRDMKHLFGHPPNPSRYQQTLEAIHRKAPNARILVSGYPHLFPQPPEDDYLNIKKDDQKFLNKMARDLNASIQRQVQEEDTKWYGNGRQKMGSFEYVDNWDALKGHEITTDDPWINGLSLCLPVRDDHNPNCPGPAPLTGTGTFHPNPDGQRSFQRGFARQLREGPGRVLYDP